MVLTVWPAAEKVSFLLYHSIRYTKVLFIRVAKLKYSKMLVLPINLGLIF